jgi:hypothetical protein
MRRFVIAVSLLPLLTGTGCSGSAKSPSPPPCGPEGSGPVLAWDAPAHDDGTLVEGVDGYTIHYGIAPGTYTGLLRTGPSTTCFLSQDALPGPGTYYLVVTARDVEGDESAYSNEITRTF